MLIDSCIKTYLIIHIVFVYVLHMRKDLLCTPILTYQIGLDVSKIVSEYDQEIPQSQTADKPIALGGRATQQLQDTRKTN